MVTRLNILLTYNCSLKCKHCYVYSDQKAPGKISLSEISHFLNDGRKMGGIEWVYFGGGEPFTQYPLLLKAVQRARKLDFRVGVETNGYFARTEEAAQRMLRPLAAMGVEDLRVSNDAVHYLKPWNSPASRAIAAAHDLGIPTTLVQVYPPGTKDSKPYTSPYAERVDELRFMYAGRAVETYADQKAGIHWSELTACPRGDLSNPERLFIDTYGYVQICPGIAIGNACHEPLNRILMNFDARSLSILGTLIAQGPAGLIERSSLPEDSKFFDACHGCFLARKQMIDSYPDELGPRLVYGF